MCCQIRQILHYHHHNRMFQFVDQMLLMMEPFGNHETDDDIDVIEPIVVSRFNF